MSLASQLGVTDGRSKLSSAALRYSSTRVITTAAARREEAARMIWVGMEEWSDGNSVVGFAAFFTIFTIALETTRNLPVA